MLAHHPAFQVGKALMEVGGIRVLEAWELARPLTSAKANNFTFSKARGFAGTHRARFLSSETFGDQRIMGKLSWWAQPG